MTPTAQVLRHVLEGMHNNLSRSRSFPLTLLGTGESELLFQIELCMSRIGLVRGTTVCWGQQDAKKS